VLEGVLSQILIPRSEGKGRIAAFEVMICTDAIRNLVKESKTEQIASYIQTGRQIGMQTMAQSIQDLLEQGTAIVDESLLGGLLSEPLKTDSPDFINNQLARIN
jgi:twitching motility protein PilT